MKFEYNGNLLEEDRINLVSKEIIDKYPDITIDNAKKAAMLEGKISNKKTPQDELNRLYNIMLVNSDDNYELVSRVYKDYLHIINTNYNIENTMYVEITKDIVSYLCGFSDFPMLSDYL